MRNYYLTIKNKIVTQKNYSSSIFDLSKRTIYQNCDFEDFKCDECIEMSFTQCVFENILFGVTLFNGIELEKCIFKRCNFDFVTFADCILTECEFINCTFTKDCDFNDSVAYKCILDKKSSAEFKMKIDNEYVEKTERKEKDIFNSLSKKDKRHQKANELDEKGKYKESLKIYKEIIKDSNDPRYYISYGVCLQKLGHWKQSIKQLKKGIELKPHYCYGDAILFLAESYLETKQFKKAIEQWEIAKELEPMYPSYDHVKNEATKMLRKWKHKK